MNEFMHINTHSFQIHNSPPEAIVTNEEVQRKQSETILHFAIGSDHHDKCMFAPLIISKFTLLSLIIASKTDFVFSSF